MVRPHQLIVESYADLSSVVGLMRAHINWPQDKDEAPVWIQIGHSVDEILRDGYLSSTLKAHGVQTVGVMLDADDVPTTRYARIRNLCLRIFPALPVQLPTTGLVVDNDDQQRFGVWMMPDNASEGGLETFLRYLIPDQSEPLWDHATQSVDAARNLGANCRDCHIAKANLYTWLAWQDPPGQQPGIALTRKILNPQSASAAPFIQWFRELYRL